MVSQLLEAAQLIDRGWAAAEEVLDAHQRAVSLHSPAATYFRLEGAIHRAAGRRRP